MPLPAQGPALGLTGAPVFFINGQELQGAHSEARFSQVLEQAIAAASPVSPADLKAAAARPPGRAPTELWGVGASRRLVGGTTFAIGPLCQNERCTGRRVVQQPVVRRGT